MKKKASPKEPEGITGITVSGFKSISREQSIEIRPLTLLAGANSSGKTSMMQPLLLLKQTLEAPYDPGALLLDGPHVKIPSVDQLFSGISKGEHAVRFHVGIREEYNARLTTYFKKRTGEGLEVEKMAFVDVEGESTIFRLNMEHEAIISALPSSLKDWYKKLKDKPKFAIERQRCFLEVVSKTMPGYAHFSLTPNANIPFIFYIRDLIYIPENRGIPEPAYTTTPLGTTIPGIFEKYFASIIVQWQREKNKDKVEKLSNDLERLGLTWKIIAKPIGDTKVELLVGRLPRAVRGGARDMVNIALVGSGVPKVLPVLVALQVAEPGQIVYLEEPELDLHPRAQYAMAEVLADAAKRGVRVVVETHSSLLLLGVQTLVAKAEGKLSPEKVKLHWFKRGKDGSTEITSADLDEAGAFGDWPEDFADVSLKAESRYLDAAGARLKGR
ncbi:MAG: hypothetical protein A3F84_03205 [Candidatus Handelsmanbacteria bacterium RIFCSPLOWO2_12_FULL_64_10]|uniref:ATPase AAA-type core domain-containing protein n=1 Tax=Handelsmanbacteria sp. (strain RIFCSPLOWO2_12_FULL_64_10) TaxID=1817868 RepID=A0A1F6CAX7_HANXR|nr:MAG: hypothetical protein A3F84_03205 [Candidatus Handelsmanbacteria bacterium RIFCSPLOWO2_12_FULL_64_10]